MNGVVWVPLLLSFGASVAWAGWPRQKAQRGLDGHLRNNR